MLERGVCQVCGEFPSQPCGSRCVMCADARVLGDVRPVETVDVEGWL